MKWIEMSMYEIIACIEALYRTTMFASLVFWVSVITLAALVWQANGPRAFGTGPARSCDGSAGAGACVTTALDRGTPLGLVASVTGPTTHTHTMFGKSLKHAKSPNVDLLPIVVGKRIDLYAYTIENVEAGQELTIDYTSMRAPKPNRVVAVQTNRALYSALVGST